ncbi:UNVERIFIED_CONTAM: hypothetical protein FKN15_035029 [Acipenser sinensis]
MRLLGRTCLFVLSLLPAVSTQGGWRVVGSDHPVIAEAGDDVILPCHISPRLSAVDMEVRWFRDRFNTPVHLYLKKKDQPGRQDSDYQGRTALSPSALQTGDISLQLRNLRPSDSGIYTCLADDGRWNEEGQTEVIVTVDVTLDPNTAHHALILSAEGKRVRKGETGQDLPDNPERFDRWPCVLGRESFTSWRRYWQVHVGGNTPWRLGVSRESAKRKWGISMTPQQGYWTVQWWSGGGFTALTDPRTPLPRSLKPQKLGVYLDYEEGQLSFYNVETRSHIYTFTDMEFKPNEKLYPFFWTEDRNTDLVLESPDSDPVSAAD